MQNRSFHLSDISLTCLIRAVIRDFWTVIAAALILAMSTSLFLSWFHQPVYQGTMTYAVTARRTSYTSGSNSAAASEAASLMSDLLMTDMSRQSIRSFDPALSDFSGSISASVVGSTNFVVVTVRGNSPEQVFLALQAVQKTAPTLLKYISGSSVVQIIRNPAVGSGPVNAVNTRRSCLLAAILGAGAMVALICWFSIARETIQTRSGARRMLASPIIGSIHQERYRTWRQRMKKTDKPLHVFAPTTSFGYTEQINTVCTRLIHESTTRGSKIFLIAGVGENEGKSTVAGNVAAALALMGKKVALLDCDLRNPSLNRFFDKQYTAPMPLNELLAQPYSRENLLQCMVPHEQLGLYMLFPINADSRSSELLSGDTMVMLIQQLRVFDYVIIDTPPMGMFPDAEILADRVDASMLVVRQDYTAACDINDAIDTLNASKSSFMGCILNDMMSTLRSQYGYGSKYGKGSKYGYAGKYAYQNNDRSERGHKSRPDGD